MSAIGTWNVRNAPSGGTARSPFSSVEQLGLIEHETGGGQRAAASPRRPPSRTAAAPGYRDTAGHRRPSTGAVNTERRRSFASAYCRT